MSSSPARRSSSSALVPVIALVLGAVLIAVVVAFTGSARSQTPEEAGTPATADPPTAVQGREQLDLTAVERRDEADLLAAGPVDAPVGLVVFSDYQCPFCATWSAETLPLMMEHAEAGDLRIEWRDVNVFGPVSERAARASYAAGLQGAFWEYHDELFADGSKRSEGELSQEALVALAAELGLDAEQFEADLTSAETRQQVAANQKLGLDLGAHSTPAFLLGGEPIVGAQPSQVFEDAFQDALAAAG